MGGFTVSDPHDRRVPPKALFLSLLSLGVPVLGSAIFPDWTTGDVGLLLWILALIPGFLLSYYRGWKGATTAIAGGMAALATVQVVFLVVGGDPPELPIILLLVVVIVVVSLGSGWLASTLRRALARERHLALTDLGTGLPNRRHGILELEKSFAAAVRGDDLSLVLFDLDDFKRVNDRFGHATGDKVLAEFGAVLQRMTRAMNVSARYGGEEFISVLRGTSGEGAKIFADRVRRTFKELELPTGAVTVSAGVAEYEEGMASPDVLIAAADQALYAAKRAGRDCVVAMEAGEPIVAASGDGDEEGVSTTPGEPQGGRAAGGQGGGGEGGRRGQRDGKDGAGGAPGIDIPLADDGRGRGELVLLVDDDVDALRGLARILRRFGYSVLESPSPQQALDVVRGLDDSVDLLITDIVMPEMSGFRLVEMVGEIQGDVRVLYMSGYSQGEVDWSGVPGTAHEYLSKPISTSSLVRRVRHLLDAPSRRTRSRKGARSAEEGGKGPGVEAAPEAEAESAQAGGESTREASPPDRPDSATVGRGQAAPTPGGIPPSPGEGAEDSLSSSPVAEPSGGEVSSGDGETGDERVLPAIRRPGPGPGFSDELMRSVIRAETQVLVLLEDPDLQDALVRRLRKDDIAEVRAAESPWSLIDRLPHVRCDVLVLDEQLPAEEMGDLFRAVRSRRRMTGAPAILLLLGSDGADFDRIRALREDLPLVDFIQKPFELSALVTRIQNLLQMKAWEKWSEAVEREMNARIAAKTAELEEAREDILRRLAWLGECRDDLTGQHAERVGILSREIARRLGWSRPRSNILEKAATLHDIGKVAVPDSVLNKPGSLTPSERRVMEQHVVVGADLLSGSRNPLLRVAEEVAASHHEHWDGSGYPEGLEGEDIPLSGRIVAVADAFDSILHNRSYRGGRSREEAIRIILDDAGSQFDPQVVDAFMELVEDGALEEILDMDLVAQPEEVRLELGREVVTGWEGEARRDPESPEGPESGDASSPL